MTPLLRVIPHLMFAFSIAVLGRAGAADDRSTEIAGLPKEVNQPIRFYGRVVDQHGAAVIGVRVRLSVRHTEQAAEMSLIDAFSYFVRESDADGRFELSGVRGSLLGVDALEKQGYLAKNPVSESFWYWSPFPEQLFKPDPAKPKVFVLWKSAGAERLIKVDTSARAQSDGSPVGFDLSTGRKGNAADVLVAVIHGSVVDGRTDWAMTIAAPGGLQIVRDEYPYHAPEEGYAPEVTIRSDSKDPKWSPRRTVLLYVRTKDHRYARVSVSVTVTFDDRMPAISIHSFLNPSGSRNLEYNEAQDIQLTGR